MIPNRSECGLYKIQEGTKNEYVSINSSGDLLRWEANDGDDQKWVIVPIDKDWCNIQTRQKSEFMAVGSTGRLVRWESTGGNEQKFCFVNESDGWWEIQEGTKNENVAVGDWGEILRWERTGDETQKFKLVPLNHKPKPVVAGKKHPLPDIGDIPRINKLNYVPPQQTEFVLMGEMVLPAVYVSYRGQYTDRITQVERNPYYILRRERNWKRVAYEERPPQISTEVSVRITVGMSVTKSKSLSETLSLGLGASGGVEYKGASAALEAEINYELSTSTTTETTVSGEFVTETRVKVEAQKKFAYAVWVLCDRYTLLDGQRKKVDEWELLHKDTIKTDSYAE